MSTEQFNQSVTDSIKNLATLNKAKPDSFEDWLEQNNDSIPLDRTESACQWFDNKAKTEIPF